MCGRAFGPRFLYTWPNSKIAVMGGDQAAGVLTQVTKAAAIKNKTDWNSEKEETFRQSIVQKYDKESSALYASARLWDDGIIMPSDTR